MLVLRIEVWPSDDRPKQVVDEIRICNVSESLDTADYEVRHGEARRMVEGHARFDARGRHNTLRLVWRALGALLGEDAGSRAGP